MPPRTGSLARRSFKRAWLGATSLAILLIAGTSWAISALRRLDAPIVKPHDLQGPVPGPPSAEPRQEPSRLKTPASETPASETPASETPAAPTTGASATEPLAPAAPTLSQGQPRKSITEAEPGQPKVKRQKPTEPVNGHGSDTLDENTASSVLDKELIEGYLRESKAKMESCCNRAVGPPASVEVGFVIEPDGTVTLLKAAVTGDNAGVSSCMTTFVKDIKSIEFPKSRVRPQQIVRVPFRVGVK